MRYIGRMQKYMLAAALLTACASNPPRQLPSADWTRNTAVFVQAPSAIPYYGSGEAVTSFKNRIENDLRTAGLRVLGQQEGKGELQVFIGEVENPDSMDATFPITITRDGEQVDRMQAKIYRLDCWPAFKNQEGSLACISREVSSKILESQRVAEAMRHKAKPAPVQAAASGRTLSGKLAVLELRNLTKDLSKETAQYFTDVVRGAALKAQPQLQVMTRENLLVLLKASGKPLEECEGECEVDTGRRIGADEIVSGEILKLGTLYKLTLRLHDTHEGQLLASTQASGKTVEELDQSAQQAAADLLK